jgi:uncharacterized protein (TIGR03435 family)
VAAARLDFVNTSLRTLVLAAFRIDAFQLSAPTWLNDVRFDIQATFPAEARAQVPAMLQRLLVERFGLVSHVEPRRIDAYELVVGKDGLKIPEVEAVNELDRDFSKDPSGTSANDGMRETIAGPVRTMIIPELIGSRTVTARSLFVSRTTPRQTTEIDATRITMAEFAGLLHVNLDRPVLDKTGLRGVYRFKVELDRSAMAVRVLTTVPDRGLALNEPTGVSTFKAVEALGLRLDERRAPIDVLVIDRIERTPTEN